MTTLAVRVQALYSLSRGTQALLSVAPTVIAALLADTDPSGTRLTVLLLCTVAASFASFALNDMLDAPLDNQRFDHLRTYEGLDLDAAGGRHPLAQGRISGRAATAWVATLGAVAVVGYALLNWLALALFLTAVLLECLYCRLATLTWLKTVISGVTVAVGALIGWAAVAGTVTGPVLVLLVAWLVAWEIGGRNIPNDLADIEEDVHLKITTVPVVFGPAVGARAAFCLLLAATATSTTMIALVAPPGTGAGAVGLLIGAAAAIATLIVPGYRLLRTPTAPSALRLFNLASFHPPLVLTAVTAVFLLR